MLSAYRAVRTVLTPWCCPAGATRGDGNPGRLDPEKILLWHLLSECGVHVLLQSLATLNGEPIRLGENGPHYIRTTKPTT